MMSTKASPLVEGDYFEGAYGPSILLVLTSTGAVRWLQMLFDRLAAGEPGTTLELTGMPEVEIGGAVTDMVLRVVDRVPDRHLVRYPDGRIRWSCTPEEWRTASLLLEPLATESGHQYLTSETGDDALIEASRGEHHP